MHIGRKEVLLTVGLAVALAVAISGEMTGAFDAARDSWGSNHLGLPWGLALMAVALLVYVQSKRRELEVEAAAVTGRARLSQERARELERLVAFWQALTQALDLDAVRDVVKLYLPEISGSAEAWVVTGAGGNWTRMLGPATVRTRRGDMAITDLALDALGQPGISTKADGLECEGQVCFPMMAAGTNLGVLGLPAAADRASRSR